MRNSALLGYWLYNEGLDGWSLAGGAMILVANTINIAADLSAMGAAAAQGLGFAVEDLDAPDFHLGREAAHRITRETIEAIAREQGHAVAEVLQRRDLEGFHHVKDTWSGAGGDLQVTTLREDGEALDFNVTGCRFAEMYRRMGAEDLGFITPDVTALRLACGFPGMKILQFGFGGDPRNEYLPHEWERESVAYTGTHDNDTARGWWDGAREAERAHAGTYLAAGAHDIHWAMIRACLNSVANMAIAPFQDVLGLPASDRMNTPGTMGGNWAWRFEWSQVGAEPGRVLGLLTAASGRGGQASFLQPAQPE